MTKVLNIIKNVIKYITSTILVFCIVMCLYSFFVVNILHREYVNMFGYTYFIVATGSMSGTINVDDIVVVKLTDEVSENDIITYKNRQNKIITHRLISIDKNRLIAKGDANNIADDPIKKEQVIGKVCYIFSPLNILKIIAILLIIFILLTMINYEKIIKKFILKQEDNKVPNDLFSSNNKYDEPSTGMTVTISLNDMEAINKKNEEDAVKDSEIEVLDIAEYLEDSVSSTKDYEEIKQNELIDFVLSLLRCKKNNIDKTKMNRKWLTKYQYIYKITLILQKNMVDEFVSEVSNPPFKEIYDYDLDKVGLTEAIRNKIYEMPVYVFLRLLTYTILYNDDEMFDGIYKILKYKVVIDKNSLFIKETKNDKNVKKRLNTLLVFMKKIANRFDDKNVFELEKIEKVINIKKY